MIQSLSKQKVETSFIPYCAHTITEDDVREVVDTLNSNWLTKGPKTLLFEQAFAEYIGSKYAVAVNSGTAAMHLALLVSDIGPGDEVITTPMTFCATTEAIEYVQAKPVFVDIDASNFNLDVNGIEEKITPRTRAILPVHYGGIPCDLDKIYEIASRHNLVVIEDAAHAVGTVYQNKKIGSFGHHTAFSFYPTKNMTTCEGGALTLDDPEMTEKVKSLSLHGISKDAWKRYDCQGSWFYEVADLGYKYNFTDLQAALGLQQLKRLDEFNSVRTNLAKLYFEGLQFIEGIEMPEWYYTYFRELQYNGTFSNWHLFVIMVDEQRLKIGRNQFIEELKTRNIGTSVHFIPLHLHPYFAQKYGCKRGDFIVTEQIYDKIISLPLYPNLTEEKVHYIIDNIRKVVEENRL